MAKIVSIPRINALGLKGPELASAKILEGYNYETVEVDNDDIEADEKRIFDYVSRLKEKCLFIGGDHSISYPIVKALFARYSDKLKLVVFDAHPDLMKPMKEPTHEEWLRGVIELGVRPENVLLIGVRRESENVDKQELDYAKEKKINIIFSDESELRKNELMEFVSSGKIYLSLGIDVIDSSIISSTGYPELDGLSEKQFFDTIEGIVAGNYSISKTDNKTKFTINPSRGYSPIPG